MAAYLSAEWIAELDAAASASEALGRATADVSLVVQQEVTGAPGGDAAWHVVADHGTVRVHEGNADAPDVTFRQDHETAQAIGRGELSAQTAFMIGKLRVGGDVGLLLRHQDAFDGIEDVFDAVRAATEY